MRVGFDHEKYLTEQSKYILERVEKFDKLYLEFGGKLMGDLHAKRILQVLMRMLKSRFYKI